MKNILTIILLAGISISCNRRDDGYVPKLTLPYGPSIVDYEAYATNGRSYIDLEGYDSLTGDPLPVDIAVLDTTDINLF